MNIYALSSGPGVSGIAVIRVSGIHTKKIILSQLEGSQTKNFCEPIVS